MLKIRNDKDWCEAMTMKDLNQMISELGNNQRLFNQKKRTLEEVYPSGSDADSGDDLEAMVRQKPKRKKLPQPEQTANDKRPSSSMPGPQFKTKVVEYFREAVIDETELNGVASSTMFEGFEFCIINTDEKVASKAFLETVIVTNGGTRVQNMMPTTTHIIAAREDFRVRNIVAMYGMNVISYKWILSCLRRGFLLDLEPIYMITTNDALRAYFKRNLDQYGDHFTQPVEPDRLRDILDGISDDKLEEENLSEEVLNVFSKVLDQLMD